MSEAYGMAPAFERAVVYYTATSSTFYARIGSRIDPDSLGDPLAQLAVKAAHAFMALAQRAPGSALVVLQQVAKWRAEGKATQEQVLDVEDYLAACEQEATRADAESVLEALKPLVQKRLRKEATMAALSDMAKSGDMSNVMELLDAANTVGSAASQGRTTTVGKDSVALIEEYLTMAKLSTGVLELDLELGGGLGRKCLGVFVGGAGDGKSMALCHVAGAAMRNGLHVAVATLEISDAGWHARLLANVSSEEIDQITGDQTVRTRAAKVAAEGVTGRVTVEYFTAGATTVRDMNDWLSKLNAHGTPVDLLVVDYADKLGHKKEGGYEGMLEVYEGLRILAVERNMWVWTASQSRRRDQKGGGKKKIEIDDLADSQHKVRVADLIVTLNVYEDDQIELVVVKNRHGKGRSVVGPLPTAFARAQLTPIDAVLPENLYPGVTRAYSALSSMGGYGDEPDTY